MQKTVKIAIFQAPYAAMLDEAGRFKWLYNQDQGKQPIPAEYYLPVFNGFLDIPDSIPDSGKERTLSILEHAFQIFNIDHPAGYCARSLSVGDVVKLDGKAYVCCSVGFQECEFRTSPTPRGPGISLEQIQKAEQVLIDNGIEADEAQTVLQAIGYVLLDKELYPED